MKKRAGELGVSINYGWSCLARDGDHELWGTVAVEPEEIIKFLHASAAHHLPPNARYQIRGVIPMRYWIGTSHAMGWYRVAAFEAEPTWGHVPRKPSFMPGAGCFLIGEFVTPIDGGKSHGAGHRSRYCRRREAGKH